MEGQNIAYEARFAEGQVERLADLAAELVRLKVDVIVAQGGAATGGGKADHLDHSDRHGAGFRGRRSGRVYHDARAPRCKRHPVKR